MVRISTGYQVEINIGFVTSKSKKKEKKKEEKAVHNN